MKDPSAIYSKEWFQQHYDQRDEYRAIGDLLHETFGDGDVVDIGCGVGLIIERLDELGHVVFGVDGSSHAKEAAPQSIAFRIYDCDVTRDDDRTLRDLTPRRLVICTEVAEHLEAEHADTLVRLLCRLTRPDGAIFFTAATPGQGGHDHVNERPNSYWVHKFAQHERGYDIVTTGYMRDRLAIICPLMSFFARTAMVFR